MNILTDQTLADLPMDGPALLYFRADWCGPCKALKPVLERVSAEFPQVPVYAVDVDQNPGLMTHFRIKSVPTLTLLGDGDVRGVLTGGKTLPQVKAFLEGHL